MTNIYLQTQNISTIAMWIASIICPLIAGYGIIIDNNIMTAFIAATINIIIAIWSSYNPNNMPILNNETNNTAVCDGTEPLNPEYDSGEGA